MVIKLNPIKSIIGYNILNIHNNKVGYLHLTGKKIMYIHIYKKYRNKKYGKETVKKLLDMYGLVKGTTEMGNIQAVKFWGFMGAKIDRKRVFEIFGDEDFILTKDDYNNRKKTKPIFMDDLGNVVDFK